MIFSYYFDIDKTHLLNCHFKTLQYSEKEAGVIEITFSAEISEWRNSSQKRKETVVTTFSFPPTPKGQVKHDIDFTRVRFSEQKKWIFTVINNKNAGQKVAVGLISETANKNPLGMDVYSDEEKFNVELKANNLAILASSYVPDVLTQTLVNAKFEQTGYPVNFDSSGAVYDAQFQNYKCSEFTQGFLEPIPMNTQFKIQMDIAPYETVPLSGMNIFDLTIPKLGRIGLLKNGLEYMPENGNVSDVKRVFFGQEIKPTDFWNNSMSTKARLTVEGNGNGTLTIKYYDHTITATYDPTSTLDRMAFRGALRKTQ